MFNGKGDIVLYLMTGVLILIVLAFLLVGTILSVQNFLHELRYLNSEIDRTRGAERRYWVWRKRRLWLSLLPFVKY